ncbi:MAG: protein translocase SEC61 complex subunit gamma [Thermoprotei archaeon]|nr:protein translocase SEC61 complex subunit gamma [TACK group archaeon]
MSLWKDIVTTIKLVRKPTRDEFWLSTKITFIGLLLVGVIAFLVHILMSLLPP